MLRTDVQLGRDASPYRNVSMRTTLESFKWGWWLGALVIVCLAAEATAGERTIPPTLAGHPGNIFLTGENVVVSAPPGEVDTWRAVNYENKVAAKGRFKDGKAEIGSLPVGWYKVVRGVGHVTNRVFLAVLEPLRSPTPRTSPICIDVAMAWFFPKEKMGQVANLCQLAGINWVRDRMFWHQMEPQRGQFAGTNQYDSSAETQSGAGLQVLQVAHTSPTWANPEGRRFPLDLRDVYSFYREMARRWRGEVSAFEPWNEADIPLFGGHTGSAMASLQKAAYLGLKAGNPDVIACQNVFAIRRGATLRDFQDNEVWPYFDTFNLHNYEPLENYPALFADFRAVSGGRPMWVTETSVHIRWQGDERFKELSNRDLQLQSERLLKTYAETIHEGAKEVFYFMLPHYSESRLQYGLLRQDLTPRPGFVALAAAGRLLAYAKPLGQLKADRDTMHGYLFDAKPDGEEADVVVIWDDQGGSFSMPKPPRACFDHLGRRHPTSGRVLELSQAPLYVLLAKDSRPDVTPTPEPATYLPGKAANVVMQVLFPVDDVLVRESAYKFPESGDKTVPVFFYNFGQAVARGRLQVTVPDGWRADFARDVELEPGERKEVTLRLSCGAAKEWSEAGVRIRGDFGEAGRAVVSWRLRPETRVTSGPSRARHPD